MKLKLFGNTVLLQPLPKPKQSPAGVFYVERYRDDLTQYRVLATGPGRKLKSGVTLLPEVRPGDKVLFNVDAGIGVKHRFPNHCVIVDADEILMRWL